MANSFHTSTVPCPLHVSGLSVDFSKSAKNVESAQVRIGELHTPVERGEGKTLQHTFSSPIMLSIGDSFSLHVRHNARFGRKAVEDIRFDTKDIFRLFGASGEPETQEYTKSHKNFTIIVKLSRNAATEAGQSSSEHPTLQPTTDEIIRICPRFRILVIGNTGVGKSSLIAHAFGVKKSTISHNMPGEATIDDGFISPQNDRFVLHDSKGFEPGAKHNFDIVQDFIDCRGKMPDLKDQLHAVWLCFEIPCTGGRLLETATETFLTLKRDNKLGKIPLIVVLTKYDELIKQVNFNLPDSLEGLSEDDVNKRIKDIADAELQDICFGPIEKFAGPNIPYAVVSTEEKYKEMMVHLIQMTEERVREHVSTEASAMASIAQRVDPDMNIEESIRVGKRRYWKALSSSAAFQDRRMQDCLDVLHTDIVTVWNFRDTHHRYLHSSEFRKLMLEMLERLDVRPTANPNKTIAVGLPMVAAIAGIVSALAGPAAPIVVPIAAGVVVAVWAYDVYQKSHEVLRRLMCYIIDLTLVLRTLYFLSENQELSRRAIKLAVASYRASSISGDVQTQIQKYDKGLKVLEHADHHTLDKITELMKLNVINSDAEAISKLREQIAAVGLLQEEAW